MKLTRKLAAALVRAAEEHAASLGRSICTAVVDESGHLQQFNRMEGTPAVSVELVQLKATG